MKEAADGVNPFEGFTPKLADGESLTFGTEEFEAMEAKGLEAVAKTAFVLVSRAACLCQKKKKTCKVIRFGFPRPVRSYPKKLISIFGLGILEYIYIKHKLLCANFVSVA